MQSNDNVKKKNHLPLKLKHNDTKGFFIPGQTPKLSVAYNEGMIVDGSQFVIWDIRNETGMTVDLRIRFEVGGADCPIDFGGGTDMGFALGIVDDALARIVGHSRPGVDRDGDYPYHIEVPDPDNEGEWIGVDPQLVFTDPPLNLDQPSIPVGVIVAFLAGGAAGALLAVLLL